MRYVDLDAVEPGHILGKTIFSSNGNVLLAEGVQLTPYMITTLRRIGVEMIYIRDELFDDVEIVDPVSEENKRFVMKQMGELYQSLRSGKAFNPRSVSVSVDALLDDLTKNKDVLLQLNDIRTEDNRQYIHALNVCIISVMIGLNMDLSPQQLKDLAIGALLHDVGKVGLDPSVKEDTGRMHHTWRGFEILKKDFSLMSAHVALQHHEQPNGHGVPRGLTSDQIHLFAKIVSAANIYDNLLYNEETGKRMMPHEACEQMMAMSGTKLDREVLIHFTRTVSSYPTGISVRLSTRETGVVVGQHRGLPGRPVVRVVKREDEHNLEIKEVDLAKATTVFIERVLT
jgi:HD-GYP domain-containing protein (c-di-GMP phosphodiesterase class II)